MVCFLVLEGIVDVLHGILESSWFNDGMEIAICSAKIAAGMEDRVADYHELYFGWKSEETFEWCVIDIFIVETAPFGHCRIER